MVMFFHFFQGAKGNDPLLPILNKISIFGQTGVTLFFVLSGFLITRILINSKQNEGYFKTFYLRRSLRIFPLYYMFLGLYYFIFPLIQGMKIPSFDLQLYYYIYLQNFAITFDWKAYGPFHYWSLSVEEHFYLFWPFMVYFLSTRHLKTSIFFIILLAMILRFIMVSNDIGVFYFTFTRFDSLAIGSLLAFIELKGGFSIKNKFRFLLLLTLLIFPTLFIWTQYTGQGNPILQVFKFTLISTIYFSLIGFVLCIKEDHFLNKILKSDFFVYTGRISYGLYVFHPVVFTFQEKYFSLDLWVLNLIFGFSVAYLVSALSFHFFESSFLKLKRHFEYDKKKPELVI